VFFFFCEIISIYDTQARIRYQNAPQNEGLHRAWQKLNSPFTVPRSVRERMWGPLFPRPEFLADIDQRILHNTKGVMYVGASNLGKTVAVLSRLAGAGDNEIVGLPGVMHLSMRQIQDQHVFSKFAHAIGLDPSKGQLLCILLFVLSYELDADPIALEYDFTELLVHFNDVYKRPAIIVIEDVHSE
jgi:hypothetical protein